ncbi:MAG: hypothetical protein M0P31_12780 [Solirubrobacteraceae bacterium]|nr:hypothetical protein [Solirubrobacteraceae bacterium]
MSSFSRVLASVGAAGAVALLAPGVAIGATSVKELGVVADEKKPQCPENCSLVTRTTVLPTSVTGSRTLFEAPSNGRIVAWSVTLGDPVDKDREALEKQLGRAKAQLVILRRVKGVTTAVKAGSSVKHLDPYFGSTVTFALPRSLSIRKGDALGISVPTWAPVLVQGYDAKTSWRASRPKGRCGGTTAERMQDYYTDTTVAVGKTGTFNCLYKAERMAYTATFIPTPTRTKAKPKAKKKASSRSALRTLILRPDLVN